MNPVQSQAISLGPQGPVFSRTIPGLMRLHEWGLDAAGLNRWIHECLEMGCDTFDHADIYGGYTIEAAFGAALALTPGLQERLTLVTKCGIGLLAAERPAHRVHHYDTSAAHIVASAERSLRHFGTDRLDVLLIHRPDPLMDADAVAAALAELRRAGKVAHCGVSNFRPWQFDLLQSRLDFPLVTNQVELSLLHLEPLHDGTLDQAQQLRRPPMVWGPLAGGRLFRADEPRAARVRQALDGIAGGLGVTPEQVALAWLHQHPARPLPVLGTGRLERIRAAVAAETLRLDRQDWFALWEASAGHEVP